MDVFALFNLLFVHVQIMCAEYAESSLTLKGAAALLVSLQFGAVTVAVGSAPAAKVAKRMSKTASWAAVFKIYLAISTLFWGVVAAISFSGSGI